MGLSASQARFLQLTARKSNVEYQAQQITFQRLQLSNKLEDASSKYEDKMINRKLVFKFNNGTGATSIDVTYKNYKNYMNQQMEGLTSSHEKYYLVSSSGNKIVVASEAERDAMIEANTTYTLLPSASDSNNTEEPREDNDKVSADTSASDGQETPEPTVKIKKPDENGVEQEYLVNRKFVESDFLIVDNLDDDDAFQAAIEDGTYFFAKYELPEGEKQYRFITEAWDTLGGGAITEEYDKTDDAQAEATYDRVKKEIQKNDKALEMELDRLESERTAVQTELDSVSKVIDDNIEKSFKIFG